MAGLCSNVCNVVSSCMRHKYLGVKNMNGCVRFRVGWAKRVLEGD